MSLRETYCARQSTNNKQQNIKMVMRFKLNFLVNHIKNHYSNTILIGNWKYDKATTGLNKVWTRKIHRCGIIRYTNSTVTVAPNKRAKDSILLSKFTTLPSPENK